MPNQLPLQFGKGREGYDVVYAVRQKRKEGVFKRFCYWAFYRLMAGMVPFDMPLDSGDFCLMDRRMVDIIKAMPERNRFVRGIRAWAGFKQTGVVYKRHARAAGEPKYGFRKLFKLAWDGLFSFSSKPLRMATYLGFWVSAFAFLGVIFTFLQKVFARQFAQIGLEPWPHGMSTVMISILFLGGVRLIGIGILGEYIGRIYDEVKGRPLWIIQDSAGIKNRDKFHQKRTLFRFTSQLVIPSPRAVI